MKQSLRRLLVIAFIALLWIFITVYGLRNLGLKDQFEPLEHPMNTVSFWLIGAGEGPTDFHNFKELQKNIILGATVQSLSSGELVISDKHYIHRNDQVIFLRTLNMESWKELNPDSMTLIEFIDQFSDQSIYLNLNRLNILNNATLLKSIEPLKDNKDVLIECSQQGIKSNLKKKHPWWLYSNTAAELGKLKLMSAIYLETMATLDADFVINLRFDQRLKSELRRRHKKIIFDARDKSPNDIELLRSLDGIVTTQPKDFLSLVD